MQKKSQKTAIEAELEQLPNMRSNARKWTPQQDSLILRFCPEKGVPGVARALGIPEVTVRRRFRELKDKLKAGQ